MDLSELITVLEGAEEGSRELDARIGYAVDFTMEGMPVTWRQTVDALGWDQARWSWMPNWTTSVDAALSLIPDGWTVGGIGQNDSKAWYCELREGYQTSYGRVIIAPSRPPYGTTAPLAICIASLKAHSTLSEQGKGGGG